MIKLGVNTVLFKAYSLRELAGRCKGGIRRIEISAIKGMCEHLNLDDWKKDKARFYQLQTSSVLSFCQRKWPPLIGQAVKGF